MLYVKISPALQRGHFLLGPYKKVSISSYSIYGIKEDDSKESIAYLNAMEGIVYSEYTVESPYIEMTLATEVLDRVPKNYSGDNLRYCEFEVVTEVD